jgi:DNA-binding LacI/PurR family transcriptional regulator/signal transduction histidine kinase
MGRLFRNGLKTVAVVMGNIRGGFVERCWESLTACARAKNCNLLALPGEVDLQAGMTAARCDEAYAFAQAGNVDGVVVLGSNISFQNRYQSFVCAEGAAAFGVPVAVLGRDVPGLPCVLMDGEAGVREALLHLTDYHGYRRIGFVKGREGHPDAESRFRVYREVLASRGIAFNPAIVYPGNFSYTSGIRAADRILQDGLERMEAIFACNDDLALGLLRGLHLQSLSVPADIRLVGFDDSCEEQSGLTHIASVRQPLQEMADWVMDAVLQPDTHDGERVRTFPSRFIPRASCGCTSTEHLFVLDAATGAATAVQSAPAPVPATNGELAALLEPRCGWLLRRADQEVRHGMNGREAFVQAMRLFSERFWQWDDFTTMMADLEAWLVRLVHAGDDMSTWDAALDAMRLRLLPQTGTADAARARGAFLQLRAVVAEARGNKRRIERFRSNATQLLRNEALNALASVDSIDGLRAALEKQLPDLGVSRYLLSLFASPEEPEPAEKQPSLFDRVSAATFEGDDVPSHAQILFSMGLGIDVEEAGGRCYPALSLLPEGIRFSGERMDLILEPLFFGERQYGYQVCDIGPLGENLSDTFRPQITAALHTIGLIRQLRETADSLRRTQRQLVQSEKMASLGTLVAGFAHELNTPIGIGVTATSYLQHRFEDIRSRMAENRLEQKDLTKCLDDGEAGVRLLTANLTKASELVASFKRVAADQASEQRRQFGMRQYLQQILFSLRPQLSKTLPAVEVICPDDLMVDTYPGALFQVLSNLLLNSVMHAYPDGKTGRVVITVKEERGFVHIRYEDDGVGIPEPEREKIFEPFYTTARGRGGTGIGLHIVYNAVTQMLGGRIACSAAASGGARFDVWIRAELSNPGI